MPERNAAGGVYAIINTRTGQQYIGQSDDIFKRWRLHVTTLNLGSHACHRLQEAWKKHGSKAFVFSVVASIRDYGARIRHESELINSHSPRRLFNTRGVSLDYGIDLDSATAYCICDYPVSLGHSCEECKRTWKEIVRGTPAYKHLPRYHNTK